MKLKLNETNSKKMAKVLEKLSDTVLDITFFITEVGLKVATFDPSKTTYFELLFEKSFFADYPVIVEPMKASLATKRLKDILKKAKGETTFEFGEVLIIHVGKSSFKLPFVDELEEHKEVNMKFEESFSFESSDLLEALSNCKIVSNMGAVTFDKEGSKLNIKFRDGPYENENVYDLNQQVKKAKSSYGIDLLERIIFNLPNTLIEFEDNKPIQFTFSDEGIIVKTLLAPRVDEI